jgi:hypothetical protein
MEIKMHPDTEKGLDDVRNLFGKAFDQAKKDYGEVRKAASILKAHPVGMIVSELVFPKGVADGTLEGALKLNGPSAVNREPTITYDPTL